MPTKALEIWKYANPEIRAKVVASLNDEKLLKQIALNDMDSLVKIAAIKKLEDCNILSDVTESNSKEWVKEAAVKQLVQIFYEDNLKLEPEALKIKAAKVIDEQHDLASKLMNEATVGEMLHLLKKINTPDNLAEITQSDIPEEIKQLALKKMIYALYATSFENDLTNFHDSME